MNAEIPESTVLSLTPAMAVMSVAVMAIAADGHFSAREIERLRMMAYFQPLFSPIKEIESFIGQRAADLRAVGQKILIEDCRKTLTPRLRQTAYAWAVEMVQADDAVVTSEHIFLNELAEKFAIPGPLARKLQAAAAIRRRTS